MKLLFYSLLFFGSINSYSQHNNSNSITATAFQYEKINEAVTLMSSQKYDDAIRILELLKENAEKKLSPQNIIIYMKLELCYGVVNNNEKIFKLYSDFENQISLLQNAKVGIYLLYKFFATDFQKQENYRLAQEAIKKSLAYFYIAQKSDEMNNHASLLNFENEVHLIAFKANLFRLQEKISESKDLYQSIITDKAYTDNINPETLADIYQQYAHLFSRTNINLEIEFLNKALQIFEEHKIYNLNLAGVLNSKYQALNYYGYNPNSNYLIEKAYEITKAIKINNVYELSNRSTIISSYIEMKSRYGTKSDSIFLLYKEQLDLLAVSTTYFNSSYILIANNAILQLVNSHNLGAAKNIIKEGLNYLEHFNQLDSKEAASFYIHLTGYYDLIRDTINYERYAKKAYEIHTATSSFTNIDYLTSVGIFSHSLSNAGRMQEAINVLEKSIVEFKIISSGPASQIYNNLYFSLALLYFQANNLDKAAKNLIHWRKILNSFAYSNSSLFLNYDYKDITELKYDQNVFYSYAIPLTSSSDEIKEEILNTAICMKNISLNMQRKFRSLHQPSLLNNYYSLRNKLFFTQITKNNNPVLELELKANISKYEFEISKAGPINTDKVTLKYNRLVQTKLNDKEAYVEVVCFNEPNKPSSDSSYYYALLMKNNSAKPEAIYLFKGIELGYLFSFKKTYTEEGFYNSLYNIHMGGNNLKEFIFQPLQKHLNNISKIYFSTDSYLSLININAIPFDTTTTFSSKYLITNINSTSEWLNAENENYKLKELIVFGGIDYDLTTKNKSENTSKKNNFYNTTERGGFLSWEYLPGTLNEVQRISTVFSITANKSYKYIDKEATEEKIKRLSGKKEPYVLHIATHGYFFPDPKIEKTNEPINSERRTVLKFSENPLFRSGLIMAGANKTWSSTASLSDTAEDGILTAYEISNLDLSSCQLVVLSACETGLGDIKGSEGVFGLQRAFKLAGVKNIIMSLWKVPDEQTAELFELFYQNCFKGMSISEALSTAQSTMSKKYPPYYWAAFKLLE